MAAFHSLHLLFFSILVHPVQGWMVLSSSATSAFFGASLEHYSLSSRKKVFLTMGIRGKKIRREKRKALKEPTPPVLNTPYGKIRFNRPPRICDCCGGTCLFVCVYIKKCHRIIPLGYLPKPKETLNIQLTHCLNSLSPIQAGALSDALFVKDAEPSEQLAIGNQISFI